MSVFNGYKLTDSKITAAETELGWQVEDTLAGQKICELLRASGINCNATPNLSQLRAEKLISNAVVNALSAIEKKTLGEVIANKKMKKIIEGIVNESYEVLKGDYNLPDLETLREKIDRFISQASDHYSSMYQDFTSGRNTEVEFFNGLIIKLGKEKGIPTPYNQQVYLNLIEQEATRILDNPKQMPHQEF